MIETVKSTTVFIGPIRVTVELVDVIEDDGPHTEIQITVSSTVEGEHKAWSCSQLLFNGNEEQEYQDTVNRFKRMETT